ncbi:MAG: hypothetical protein IPK00_27595 [Deltaproteobacteria bacterium]|nr:hypothetical protein [Deltaproteobacteria bacterium]
MSRTAFEYIYRIAVDNSGGALTGVTANVTTPLTETVIIDGSVTVGNLAAGASGVSSDTFTVRQDRSKPFNRSALVWTVSGTSANDVNGVLLQGNPTDAAIEAVVDTDTKEYFGPADFLLMQSGVSAARSALRVILSPTATVGGVNALFESIDARIKISLDGVGIIVISFPPLDQNRNCRPKWRRYAPVLKSRRCCPS